MIAFTFPGQGSQRQGMGEAWADQESWELVTEASEIAGRDVEHLLLRADADELKDTRNAQLTTFVLSLVVLDAVERTGLDASFMAGHSLGEYTALTAAGALSFDDGVRLVCERGDAMAQAGAANHGTMAAVLGMDDEQVEIACRLADADVWVANFNAPGQVVIAGSPEGVAAATAKAKEMGGKKVMPLPVSGAFHTPFMQPARDRLREAISAADPRDTEVPIVSNVDAQPHQIGSEWSALLSAQLCSPVRWRHCLETLFDSGVRTFIELGPGGVLTGMAKRTLDNVRTLSVSTPTDLAKLLATLSAVETAAALPPQTVLEGEHLFVRERMVVSPAAGVFTPHAEIHKGSVIDVGSVLGVAGTVEVRSPFKGIVMGMLAVDGERVTQSQPIAWLLTE